MKELSFKLSISLLLFFPLFLGGFLANSFCEYYVINHASILGFSRLSFLQQLPQTRTSPTPPSFRFFSIYDWKHQMKLLIFC